jgi:hypothetical protein
MCLVCTRHNGYTKQNMVLPVLPTLNKIMWIPNNEICQSLMIQLPRYAITGNKKCWLKSQVTAWEPRCIMEGATHTYPIQMFHIQLQQHSRWSINLVTHWLCLHVYIQTNLDHSSHQSLAIWTTLIQNVYVAQNLRHSILFSHQENFNLQHILYHYLTLPLHMEHTFYEYMPHNQTTYFYLHFF